MKERERCIKAIALSSADEVVKINIVPIFTRSGGVEVKFSNLKLAFDREPILHVVACSI
jgi:hypothetical protein